MSSQTSVVELIQAEAGAVTLFTNLNEGLDRPARKLFEFAAQDHQKRVELLKLELKKLGVTMATVTAQLPEEIGKHVYDKSISDKLKIRLANSLQILLAELYQQAAKDHPDNSMIHRMMYDQGLLAKRFETLEQAVTKVLPPKHT
jgi:hypothetical protein